MQEINNFNIIQILPWGKKEAIFNTFYEADIIENKIRQGKHDKLYLTAS